jgi:hypothetical protein
MNQEHFQPNEKTINDAYKLTMLAAQLERLDDGTLNFKEAHSAWKQAVEFLMDFNPFGQVEGIRFDNYEFKTYPLKVALEMMDLTSQNWKNTIRKKLKRYGLSKEQIKGNIEVWETCGVPSIHIEQLRNERTKPIPGLDD